jgi:hypothetical protein
MVDFDLSAYKATASWSSIPQDCLSGALDETVNQDRFPGFILPAWVNGGVCWYAVATDQREWRALQPILNAYVGHTVTTFNGEPAELDSDIEVEAYLAILNVHAVARLVPSQTVMLAVRALERMKKTLLARPTDLRPPQMSTAQMISHFDMCLVGGDRGGALHWLSRLKEELCLDALNMSFSRVKLHANFREWNAILSDRSFADLCRAKKPAVVAHHLLEALWFVYLESHPKASGARRSAYENHCRPFVEDIHASSGSPSSWSTEAFKEFVREGGDGAPRQTAGSISPVDSENGASPPIVDEAGDGGSQDNVVWSYVGFESSTDPEPFPQIPRPDGWLGWIKSLDKKELKFNEAAEELALNDEIEALQDPEDVRDLEEALFDLGTRRELDRLGQTLPQIIKWLKRDDEYPRKLLSPLFGVVLFRLIETRNREGEFREGIAEMFTALLDVGLSGGQYKNLLNDIAGAIPDGAGTSDAFWLLDIAEVLCRFSAPQEAARNTLLNKILGSLQPIVHQLSSLQQSAYSSVALAAGWDPLPEDESAEQKTIADILKGKVIGIYTLTETAGRQATAALKRIAPDVQVEVSSEKVCTPRLTKLSQNADFMVVTTSSAKHAATDCIRAQRDADRILYAAGRGCCSILRSLEENLT